MEVTSLYEIRTEGLTATRQEIATLLVNIDKGFKLRGIYADGDRLCFLMEYDELLKENTRLKELNREMVGALKEIKEIVYTIATNKGNLDIGYVIDFYKEVGNELLSKAGDGE